MFCAKGCSLQEPGNKGETRRGSSFYLPAFSLEQPIVLSKLLGPFLGIGSHIRFSFVDSFHTSATRVSDAILN